MCIDFRCDCGYYVYMAIRRICISKKMEEFRRILWSFSCFPRCALTSSMEYVNRRDEDPREDGYARRVLIYFEKNVEGKGKRKRSKALQGISNRNLQTWFLCSFCTRLRISVEVICNIKIVNERGEQKKRFRYLPTKANIFW